MKPWQWIVVVLALLMTAGCRSDPAVPILERELRLKEDEIYRLRANLDDMQDCGSCQDRSASGRGSDCDDSSSRRRRDSNNSAGTKPPQVDVPSQPSNSVPDALKTQGGLPPGIDVPKGLQEPSKPLRPKDGPPGSFLPKRSSDRRVAPDAGEANGPALEKSAGRVGANAGRILMASQPGAAEPITPAGDSRRVTKIVLNRTLTGGINDGNRSGDQGLLVVAEPRDSSGRTVDAPAEMSVVVLDRALEGDASRIARWDFTAAETAGLFRRAGGSPAIHLTMAWPAEPPVHSRLHLYVRYVTADGHKLEANMPIDVALGSGSVAQSDREDPEPAAAASPAASVPAAAPQSPETPAAQPPSPTPQMATRPDDAKSRRPVWSPDRR
jgi:hypothetical protein